MPKETKFQLFGNKHFKWVWHKSKDEYVGLYSMGKDL